MRIEYLCHASLAIETADAKLLTDPWLDGGAYFGSWTRSHEIPAEQRAAILATRYVWLSHGHPDHLSGESLARSLLRGNWTYFPALCWRTSVVQGIGFRSGLNVVQDLALLLDVSLQGGALLLDPEVTFAYRRHAASDEEGCRCAHELRWWPRWPSSSARVPGRRRLRDSWSI